MSDGNQNKQTNCRNGSGIVLLVTLVFLVVLSTLSYTLTSRVVAQRHRERYIIDYQAARYACDSGLRYTLATLDEIAPELISRPNEPDFSDLFILSEEQYQELLAEWAAKSQLADSEKDEAYTDVNDSNYASFMKYIDKMGGIENINDVNDADFNDIVADIESAEPNTVIIRGPYGPPWPLVSKPAELEVGSVKVKIEIEDENAKYPIGWVLLEDENINREAVAGFETFCEWMDIDSAEIDALKEELDQIKEVKQFKLDFKPKTAKGKDASKQKAKDKRGRTSKASQRRSAKKKVTIPASAHTADFVKIFHSSLIDTDILARPTIVTESRKESALKYMGRWGSTKVNVNTAPRQVLEAAFTFGGDADKIAEEIIQQRRIKPFDSIENLKTALLQYSDSIRKCEKYITTVSRFFTVRITAVSGAAKVSMVLAITKDGKGTEKIAVISG